MTRQTEDRPVRRTSRARLLVHVLFALAAWALFAWAWYVVFVQRVSDQTYGGVLALGVFLVLVLLLTLVWVRHNISIYRRKGARTTIPTVREDWSRDVMGRRVEASWAEIRAAQLIVVDVTEGEKHYRVDEPPPGTPARDRPAPEAR